MEYGEAVVGASSQILDEVYCTVRGVMNTSVVGGMRVRWTIPGCGAIGSLSDSDPSAKPSGCCDAGAGV